MKRSQVVETSSNIPACEKPLSENMNNPYGKNRHLCTAVNTKDQILLKKILEDSNNSSGELSQNELDQAMLISVTTQQPEMLETLLKAGADIHAFDKLSPLLHTIVDLNSIEMFDIAIRFVKTVDVRSMSGNLLHSAVTGDNVELVQRVYEAGVTDIGDKSPTTGKTPLHVAVSRLVEHSDRNMNISESDLIIETTSSESFENSGLDVELGNDKSSDSSTISSSLLCKSEGFDVLDFLLSKPFEPLIDDWYQDSPLHYAVRFGSLAVCKRLVRAGVSKRVFNSETRTPWMEAIERKYEHLYDVLADTEGINVPIYRSKYYLHLACELKNCDMVSIFLDAGAQANVCYTNSSTSNPIDVALWNRDADCVSVIINHPNFTLPTNRSDEGVRRSLSYVLRFPDFEKILERLCFLGACEHYGHLASDLLISNYHNLKLVKWMIERGVNPNVVISECYAIEQCSIECDDVLEYLIMNNADPSLTKLKVVDMDEEYREPPLVVLIERGNFPLARLAFAAGFDTVRVCEKFCETTISNFFEDMDFLDMEFDPTDDLFYLVEMMKEHAKNPRSLKTTCRTVVMKALGCFETEKKIKNLGLPSHVVEFLNMTSFIQMRVEEIDAWIKSAKQSS